jgi:hypothetical protein
MPTPEYRPGQEKTISSRSVEYQVHGVKKKFLAFDHIQITIPNGQQDKERTFYDKLLGFTKIAKPTTLTGRGGAWFQYGIVVFNLGVEIDFRPSRKAHPALLVDNWEAFLIICHPQGWKLMKANRLFLVPCAHLRSTHPAIASS